MSELQPAQAEALRNVTCLFHEENVMDNKEFRDGITAELKNINSTLAKIDKDLAAQSSAGRVRAGILGVFVTLTVCAGSYFVNDAKEKRFELVTEVKELRGLIMAGMERRMKLEGTVSELQADIREMKAFNLATHPTRSK